MVSWGPPNVQGGQELQGLTRCWMAACFRSMSRFSTAESITSWSSCGGGASGREVTTHPLRRVLGPTPARRLTSAANFFM